MDKIDENNQLRATWWGPYSLDDGQTIQWEIGPLRLAIQRRLNEWHIAYEQRDVIDPETSEWSHIPAAPDIIKFDYANTERHVVSQTNEKLWIRPVLADRPIIIRPLMPLYVPTAEEITIFASSPLWMSIEVGDPPKKLQEIPIQRPSDTWFGPSTMEGELCYASRTHGRLRLEQIPTRAHRAITQLTVRNQASSSLLVERFSLPVPYLTLFETADSVLWTQSVVMERTRDAGLAAFHVEPDPSEQAGETRSLGEPRQQPTQSMIIRAFGVLFRV